MLDSAMDGPVYAEGEWPWLDAAVAHWAKERPEHLALDDGERQWSFGQLQAEVLSHAAKLNEQQAPATVLLDAQQGVAEQVVEFLGVLASGRCAALGDADWPDTVLAQVKHHLLPHQQDFDPGRPRSPLDPFYVGFTSGSTGVPKGFRRHHRSWAESFRVGLAEFGADAAQRVLAPGRLSHSLFLFGVMQGLWSGAGAVVQTRFSAARCLDWLSQGKAPCLVAVPSQLLLMLEMAQRRQLPAIDAVQMVMISGARWMRQRTPELKALFPKARIVEFYGASETSFIAWMDASADAPLSVVGRPFSNVELSIRPNAAAQDTLAPGQSGLIYVRSPMLFSDYVGAADSTAALRDGDWLSVRDMGYLNDEGMLCLEGREKRMIVTQGKNLFPEELESVLSLLPGVQEASVHGVADSLRGMQVVAVLQIAPQENSTYPVNVVALNTLCRQQLEAYKTPRRYWVCNDWPRTASGKTDHGRLAAALAAAMAGAPENPAATETQPCPSLIPLS